MGLTECVVAAGKIEGDIRINGHPKQQATFARVSGYVEQFDTHTAAASVHEALLFSGTLRTGKEVDKKTTAAFVDQVGQPWKKFKAKAKHQAIPVANIQAAITPEAPWAGQAHNPGVALHLVANRPPSPPPPPLPPRAPSY